MGEASVATDACDTPFGALGSTPLRCTADANGQVPVDYNSSAPTVPNGGTDTIAASFDSSGSNAVTDTYTYATIDHYGFSPSPIAATGSLHGGEAQVTLNAYDSANQPIPGAPVYVSLNSAPGTEGVELDPGDSNTTGFCAAGVIGSTPVLCHTGIGVGRTPDLKMFYVSSAPTVPNGGTDTITAALDTGGTGAVTDTYTYATIDHYGFSPTPIAPSSSLTAGAGVVVTLNAYDSANQPIPGAPVYVSFSPAAGSTGTELAPEDPNTSGFCGAAVIHSTPVLCFTGIGVSRTPDLKLSYTSSSTVPNGGTDTITAALDTNGSGAVTDTYSYGRQTTLSYTGATSGDSNDPATLSAMLVEQGSLAPIQGVQISFALNNAEGCTATTDASGHASCTVTPGEAAGGYTVQASFAGTGAYLASSASSPFTVTLEDTSLALTAPAFVATGGSLTLAATLTDPASVAESESATPISGKTISFSLGSGAGTQTCTGTTDSTGAASCTIGSVNQPLGSGVPVAASFAGDSFDHSATATSTAVVFAYLARGSFVVGDRSATVNGVVTWWSPMWSSSNQLSGGSAPSGFKGFAAALSSSPPAAGGSWTTTGGQSAKPPTSVPSYMAVIVSSKVKQTGSTIFSGTDTKIAIVRVFPGYNPSTGSPGTGKLLGFLP